MYAQRRLTAFFNIQQGEVARGIIRVLTSYLRSWVDNADLRIFQQSVAKTVPLPIKRGDVEKAKSQSQPSSHP